MKHILMIMNRYILNHINLTCKKIYPKTLSPIKLDPPQSSPNIFDGFSISSAKLLTILKKVDLKLPIDRSFHTKKCPRVTTQWVEQFEKVY